MGLVALPGGSDPDPVLTGAHAGPDFEQEIVDQYALAMAAGGLSDGHIRRTRAIVIEFARTLRGPLWAATCVDADAFLAEQRRLGHSVSTRAGKAGTLAGFYDFVIARYEGTIRRATGVLVEQPIDEFNRQSGASLGKVRVPPADEEVDALFTAWRESVTQARKYLPAARDYFAGSLWRRVGLRINETVKLDIRDWRPDLGSYGKLHIRFGKGSQGRGPKPRLVPAINGADKLMDWWLAEVRPQYGPDWADPDAPLLPSERFDRDLDRCGRVGANALRRGLTIQVDRSLPAWSGRMTPHVLRHYCASSLYAAGMDIKALQELLGHQWLATTSGYSMCGPSTSSRHGTRPTSASKSDSREGKDELMQWNLRLRAAERGIWKSAALRRMLADSGLEISAGKMSSWWAGNPPTLRLEELDVLCTVLDCTPNDLMTPEPDKVIARRPRISAAANGNGNDKDGDGNGGGAARPAVAPRLGKPRSRPPL